MGILLKRLVLRNVASYGTVGNSVDFSSLYYPAYVSGPNGAGKTTFFVDGLSFALFGSAYGLSRGAGKLFIPAGKKVGGEVLLELEWDGRIIRIRRWFEGGGWRVEVREISGSSRRLITSSSGEAVRFVQDMLGLDYDSFINSVVVRQGDVYSFLDAKPSRRRELLLNLLNINFQPIREKLREQLNERSGQLNRVEGKLTSIEGQLKFKDYKEIDAEKHEINHKISSTKKKIKDVKDRLEKLRKSIDELSGRLGRHKEKVEGIEKLRKNVRRLQKKLGLEDLELSPDAVTDLIKDIDQFTTLNTKIDNLKSSIKELKRIAELHTKFLELKQKYDELINSKASVIEEARSKTGLEPSRETLESLSSEMGALNGRLREIGESLALLEDPRSSTCPLCGQVISKEHRDNVLSSLRREKEEVLSKLVKINELKTYLNDVLKKIVGIETELTRLKGQIDSLESQLKGIEYKKVDADLSQKETELSKLKSELAIIRERFESRGLKPVNMDLLIKRRQELVELSVGLNQLRELEEELRGVDLEGMERELEGLRAKERKLNDDLVTFSLELQELEAQLRELDKQRSLLSDYIEAKKEKVVLEKEVRLLRLLDEYVFKESRFPRFLLKNLVEEVLVSLVNRYLKTIFANAYVDMRVGEEAKGIDVIVYINNVRREVSTLSGGEKTLIGFAIRLAIGELVAGLKGGRAVDFLIIDEGFGALDSVNRDLVATAVGNLVDSGLYKQVIVISHETDLMNHPVFKAYIYVSKERGVSNIKIS